jgi:hypothetical protein
MMNVGGIERTRLFVEGVGTAITAEVTRRRSDRLVVAQALPFLRLDTPVVAEGGTRARIARVAISMEGDVPRLMLELAHDAPGVSMRPARTDSTVPYDFQPRVRTSRVVAVVEGQASKREEPTTAASVEPPRARTEPSRIDSWWTRIARKLSMLLAVFHRRAVPVLPRG